MFVFLKPISIPLQFQTLYVRIRADWPSQRRSESQGVATFVKKGSYKGYSFVFLAAYTFTNGNIKKAQYHSFLYT